MITCRQELEPKPLSHLLAVDVARESSRRTLLALLSVSDQRKRRRRDELTFVAQHLNDANNVRFGLLFCHECESCGLFSF